MHRVATRTTAVLLSVGAGAALAIPLSAAADSSDAARRVTTTAAGEATGVPDTATVTLGVDSRGATATEALEVNATRTQRVIEGMQFVGVARRDIQTSGVNLYPSFDRDGRIDGYTVSTRMTATTRDVTKAGSVIDAAARLAGDDIRVDGVALSIDDTSRLVSTARRRAVRLARRQADELARAADAEIGQVHTIVEHVDATPTVFEGFAADRAEAGTTIPIEAGTQDLTVRVKVTYALR